jgi:hypothetical protein
MSFDKDKPHLTHSSSEYEDFYLYLGKTYTIGGSDLF